MKSFFVLNRKMFKFRSGNQLVYFRQTNTFEDLSRHKKTVYSDFHGGSYVRSNGAVRTWESGFMKNISFAAYVVSLDFYGRDKELNFFWSVPFNEIFRFNGWWKKSSRWFWVFLILDAEIENYYQHFWSLRPVKIGTQRKQLTIFL